MTSLFLAWQAPRQREWFPIGYLSADQARSHYVFQYTGGAVRAGKLVGFKPLPAFPNLRERYESPELFPLFKNRVLDSSRKDFPDYLRSLDLEPNSTDPIEILAISGGERLTDSFEVFPKIVKGENNTFSCRFFLHGLRHASKSAQSRGFELQSRESLQVSLEINNPATGPAIQLTTSDYEFLGWAPRYLVSDILKSIAVSPEITANVVRVNEAGVPINRRVLVELSGRLPANYEPMSGPDYRVISKAVRKTHAVQRQKSGSAK